MGRKQVCALVTTGGGLSESVPFISALRIGALHSAQCTISVPLGPLLTYRSVKIPRSVYHLLSYLRAWLPRAPRRKLRSHPRNPRSGNQRLGRRRRRPAKGKAIWMRVCHPVGVGPGTSRDSTEDLVQRRIGKKAGRLNLVEQRQVLHSCKSNLLHLQVIPTTSGTSLRRVRGGNMRRQPHQGTAKSSGCSKPSELHG